MHPTKPAPFQVHICAVGHRATSRRVTDFAAASRACREFIKRHSLGASQWRWGVIVDVATNKVVAMVNYNGRVWLAAGYEARHADEVP